MSSIYGICGPAGKAAWFTGLLLAVAVVLLPAAGCSDADAPPGTAGEDDRAPSAEVHSAPEGDIQLRHVDSEGYHAVLSEHSGDIVVADFWATWCAPCVKSFPKLVELHSEYAGRGVTVIGVSVDFPGTEEKVKAFLEEHEAWFVNLMVDADDIDGFISSVRAGWAGDIPAVFIYDESGRMAGEYYGDGAVDEARKKVAELLEGE